MAIMSIVGQIDIFSSAVDELLAKRCKALIFQAGQIFLQPGVYVDGIYYLHEGTTSHSIINEDGNIKLLYTLTPGYYFGEASYTLGLPTSLISQANTDAVFYHLTPPILEELLQSSKIFRDSLILNYSAKLMTVRYEISNLSFSSTKERLMRFFCSVADTDTLIDGEWYPLKSRYSQAAIGEIIGVTRVTVNRQVTELCQEGKLRLVKTAAQVHRDCHEEMISRDLS